MMYFEECKMLAKELHKFDEPARKLILGKIEDDYDYWRVVDELKVLDSNGARALPGDGVYDSLIGQMEYWKRRATNLDIALQTQKCEDIEMKL